MPGAFYRSALCADSGCRGTSCLPLKIEIWGSACDVKETAGPSTALPPVAPLRMTIFSLNRRFLFDFAQGRGFDFVSLRETHAEEDKFVRATDPSVRYDIFLVDGRYWCRG